MLTVAFKKRIGFSSLHKNDHYRDRSFPITLDNRIAYVWSKKNKFSKLTSHNSPIMLQLCASDVALKAPFGVSSFGDENHTRVNLALAVQYESLKTWAHGIDE